MKNDGVKVTNNKQVDWSKSIDRIFNTKKFRAICAQVIVKGIKDNTKNGLDVDGKPFKKLKLATVKQKKKKGYKSPSKPLIATGVMAKLPPIKSKSNHAEIQVAKSRSSIALYHNEGTAKMPQRKWYGVTKGAKEDIARAVAKKVIKVLKRNFRMPGKL